MSVFFNSYKKLLDTKPYATRMVTSGVLFGIGDFFSQYFIHRSKNTKNGTKNNFVINFERTLTFSAFGCFMASPVLMFHYMRILPTIAKGTSVPETLLKVGVDQLVFAPFFLAYLFYVMAKI
jgi:hypothetical protein